MRLLPCICSSALRTECGFESLCLGPAFPTVSRAPLFRLALLFHHLAQLRHRKFLGSAEVDYPSLCPLHLCGIRRDCAGNLCRDGENSVSVAVQQISRMHFHPAYGDGSTDIENMCIDMRDSVISGK